MASSRPFSKLLFTDKSHEQKTSPRTAMIQFARLYRAWKLATNENANEPARQFFASWIWVKYRAPQVTHVESLPNSVQAGRATSPR